MLSKQSLSALRKFSIKLNENSKALFQNILGAEGAGISAWIRTKVILSGITQAIFFLCYSFL